MAGHAQLQFVMAECSKTQIRLTGLIYCFQNYTVFYDFRPEDLHYSALETRALSLTSTNTYAIVDNLKACELYTFRVAAAGRGRCPLSDGASQSTGFGEWIL